MEIFFSAYLRFFLREVDFRAVFLFAVFLAALRRAGFLFAVLRAAFFLFLAGIGTTSSPKCHVAF